MKKIMGHVTGKLSLSILTVILLLVGVLAGFSRITSTKAGKSVSSSNQAAVMAAKQAVNKLPLVFEPNRGQTDSRAKYITRSSGYVAFLTDTGAVIEAQSPKTKKVDVVGIEMVGASASHTAEGVNAVGHSNYYIGKDRSKWLENVPGYEKVRFGNLYPGVDVVYQGNNRRLRYDFEVKPGASPKAIRLAFTGAKKLSLDNEGNLHVATANGESISSKPYVFQEANGVRHEVGGNYRIDHDQVSFEVGSYDAQQTLTIDPTITNGTFVGGTQADTANGVAVDGTNIYTVGTTLSPDLPGAINGIALIGTNDAFVTKLSLLLTNPVTTYIGGTADESGNAIAVGGGKVYITGQTQSGAGFPTTAGVFQATTAAPGGHAFVVSLNNNLTVNYSTLLGGTTGVETGNGIAVDFAGNAHVVGQTGSSDFPLKNAAQTTISGVSDAFYVVLNSTGATELYGTFIGGANTETANGVAVDLPNTTAVPNGNLNPGQCGTAPCNAYLVGTSTSTDLPKSAGAAPGAAGTNHGFLGKYNPRASGGSSKLYLAYIGPTTANASTANAVAVDFQGFAYVGGQTTAFVGFAPTPVASNAPGAVCAAGDGYVAKVATDTAIGAVTTNSTAYLLGATGNETNGFGTGPGGACSSSVNGIAVDQIGQAYIGGSVHLDTNNLLVAGEDDMMRRRVKLDGSGYFGGPYPAPASATIQQNTGDIPFPAAGGLIGTSAAFDVINRTFTVAGQVLDTASSNLENLAAGSAQTFGQGDKDAYLVSNRFTSDTLPSVNSVSFTVTVGQTAGSAANPFSKTVQIINQGVANPSYCVANISGCPGPAITFNPPIPPALAGNPWLNPPTISGDTITIPLQSPSVGFYDPGVYTANVPIVFQSGDNTGSVFNLPVTLNVTGSFILNTTGGGGITAPINFTKTNAGDLTFTDANAVEKVLIPVLEGSAPGFPVPNASPVLWFDLTGTAFPAGAGIAVDATAPDRPAGSTACASVSTFPLAGTPAPGVAGQGVASSNVCYVEATFTAAAFNSFTPGSYTAKVNFAAHTPNAQGGTVGTAQVPNASVTLTVNIGAPGTLQVTTSQTAVNTTAALPPPPPGTPVPGPRFDFPLGTNATCSGGAVNCAAYAENVNVLLTVPIGTVGPATFTIPGTGIVNPATNAPIPAIPASVFQPPTPASISVASGGNTVFTTSVSSPTAVPQGMYFSDYLFAPVSGQGNNGAINGSVDATGAPAPNGVPLFVGPVVVDQVTSFGGLGTNATATSTLTAQIATIPVAAAGTGFTSAPAVSVSGAGSATATATIGQTVTGPLTVGNGGITAQGTGFGGINSTNATPTVNPTVSFTAGAGCTQNTPATGTVQLTPVGLTGANTTFNVTSGGSGYNANPSVTITASPGAGCGGTGATAHTVLTGSVISTTQVAAGGPYTGAAPAVAFSGGGATTNATGHAVLGPEGIATVAVDNGGSYTIGPPTISTSPAGTPSATFTVTLNPTSVASGVVDVGGGPYAAAPAVGFVANGACAVFPTATANLGPAGQVASITISAFNPGAGCTFAPTPTFTPNIGGTTAHTLLSPTSIQSITVNTPGAGYTPNPNLPALVFNNAGTGGSGGAAHVVTMTGAGVASVPVDTAGAGYTSQPTITFTPNVGGTNFTANLASSVSGIVLDTPGSGYNCSPNVAIGASQLAGGTTATAQAVLSTNVQQVNITSGGSFTCGPGAFSSPTVSFNNAPGGVATGGSGETATVPAANFTGGITGITVTNGGSVTCTSTATPAGTGTAACNTAGPIVVSITGGGGTGASAGTPTFTPASVTSLALVTPGSTYAAPPAVTFTGGGCTTTPIAHTTISGGSVATLVLDFPGTGCTLAPGVGIATSGGIATPTAPAVGSAAYPILTANLAVATGGQALVNVTPSGNGLLPTTTVNPAGVVTEKNTATNTVGGAGAATVTTKTTITMADGTAAPSWITFATGVQSTTDCLLSGTGVQTACTSAGANVDGAGRIPISISPPAAGACPGGVNPNPSCTFKVLVSTVDNATPPTYVSVPALITVTVTNGTQLIVNTLTAGAAIGNGVTFTTVQGSGAVTGNINPATGTPANPGVGQQYSISFAAPNPSSTDTITATFTSNDGNAWALPIWQPPTTPGTTPGPFSPNCSGPATTPCTLQNTNVNGNQTLSILPNFALIATLQQGTYTGRVTINSNTNPPAPVVIPVTLIVSGLPTVTPAPATPAFSVNQGSTVSTPASIPLTLTAPGLVGNASFTATPSCVGASALLINGSTNTVNGTLTATGVTSPANMTLTINPAGLTVTNSPVSCQININVPTVGGNQVVSNSTFSIPVTITVTPPPSVSFNPTTGSANWTLGQAAASPNSFNTTLTLLGSDTITFTSNQPWAKVTTPASGTTTATSTPVTVTLDVTKANQTASTQTAIITAAGTAGESATFTVTLVVAAAPAITFTPATLPTINFVVGSPTPTIAPITIALTNTPENPNIPLTAVSNNPACTAVLNPTTMNNAGGTMTVTLDPTKFTITGNGPTTNTCVITVAGPAGTTAVPPATYTINVSVTNPRLDSASPNPIVVSAPVGGTPINVPVTLTGNGTFTFLANAVALTPQPNPTWLSATGGTMTNGTGTSTVTFTIGSLPAGQYVGSVAYSGPGTSTIALLNVPVILNVGAISADQTSIAFNHTLNFTPAAQQSTTFHLTSLTIPPAADSLGHTGLAFTAAATTTSGGNWLSVQPTSGFANSTPTTLTVAYTLPTTCTAVAGTPCHFAGDIAVTTLNSSAAVIHIPVTLDVFATPTLTATIGGQNATAVVFPATVIGNTPAPITVNVVGNGLPAGQTMPFSLNFTSAPAWLQVTPTSGNAGAAGSPISVSVNMAAFGPNPVPGTYDGTIVITSPNASNTLTLGVVLTLVPPTISVAPQGIISFTATQGIPATVTPASQTLTFSSNGTNLPISVATTQPSWLNVTVDNTAHTATLTPVLGNLTAGTYTTTVLFFAAGASNPTIPVTVTFTVFAPATCNLVLTPTSASETYIGTSTAGFIPEIPASFTITPTPSVAGSTVCNNAAWTVTSSTASAQGAANWLAVTSGGTGNGSTPATVTYTALSNPHASPRNATFTINGGNTAVGGTFTVTQGGDPDNLNSRAIRAFYQQLLGRDPDSGGFSFWQGQCGVDPSCLGRLVDQFLESPEGQSTDMATMIAYQGATGAPPTYAQWATAVAAIRTGAQTPVGLLTQLTPGLTVTQLYQNLLGRAPTATEATQSLAAAYTAITTSNEFKNLTTPAGTDHSNFLWVRLIYYVTLNRDPDTGGLQFWINQANTTYGPGIFYGTSPAAIQARVNIIGPGTPLQGFAGSPEFQGLFN